MLSASFATISFHKNIGWTWNFYLRLVKRLKLPFFGTEGFSNKSICSFNVTTHKNPLDVPFDKTPGFVAETLTAVVYQFIGNNRIKSFRAYNWRFSRTFACVREKKLFKSIGNLQRLPTPALHAKWICRRIEIRFRLKLHIKESSSLLRRRESLPSKGPGMSGVLLLEVLHNEN